MQTLGLYALTLATTVSIEAPIVAGLGLRRGRRSVLGVAILVNLASHPPATALASMAGVDWLLVEILVVAFEAWALRGALGLSAREAWNWSLIANAATAALALAWSAA